MEWEESVNNPWLMKGIVQEEQKRLDKERLDES
jgi:hypothetical protein